MRRSRIILAGVGIAVVTAGGVTAAAAVGSSGGNSTPSASASAAGSGAATVRTARTTVDGKTETILVNAGGRPLYYFRPDTATRSLVTGSLAAAWPAFTSAAPTGSGVSGSLTVVRDGHGRQVAYNGRLLYTFTSDRPGQVTGQGVANFFVATPSVTSAGHAPTSATSVPPVSSGGGYGY